MSKKEIVDARKDDDGDITHVMFKGNTRFTSLEDAIRMTDRGEVDGAHVVRPKGRSPYLRSNPDGDRDNNLDSLAGDS